jgi:hypothetical protein
VIGKMFEVFKNHGIKISKVASESLRKVIVFTDLPRNGGTDPAVIHAKLQEAVEKARNQFMFDNMQNFRRRSTYFKTYLRNKKGGLNECAVDSWNGRNRTDVAVYVKDLATHMIRYDGGVVETTLKYKVLENQYISIFDLNDHGDSYSAIINGSIQTFTNVERVFESK